MGMKFMKKAEERRRQAAREEEVEMRKDIEMFGEDGASGSTTLCPGKSAHRAVYTGRSTHNDRPGKDHAPSTRSKLEHGRFVLALLLFVIATRPILSKHLDILPFPGRSL
jgi:U3 small nucleolar RNA-associated protein 14